MTGADVALAFLIVSCLAAWAALGVVLRLAYFVVMFGLFALATGQLKLDQPAVERIAVRVNERVGKPWLPLAVRIPLDLLLWPVPLARSHRWWTLAGELVRDLTPSAHLEKN